MQSSYLYGTAGLDIPLPKTGMDETRDDLSTPPSPMAQANNELLLFKRGLDIGNPPSRPRRICPAMTPPRVVAVTKESPKNQSKGYRRRPFSG